MEESAPLPFGAYLLLKRIAKGNQTELHLAVPAGSTRVYERLVIKRLLPERQSDDARVAAFLREARLASQLVHPNLVRTREVGEQDGRAFVVMEHVDGRDLELLFRARRSSMQPVVGAIIGCRLCAALACLHASSGARPGVAHGNLTPENVMVSRAGEVKLVDFGAARPVASPLAGCEPGVRDDLRALGALLCEAVTGARPQQAPVAPQFDRACPPALADIIVRAMTAGTDEGIGSAAELLADLDLFLRDFGADQAEQLAALVQDRPLGKTAAPVHSAVSARPARPHAVPFVAPAPATMEKTALMPALAPELQSDPGEETGLMPALAPELQTDPGEETGPMPSLTPLQAAAQDPEMLEATELLPTLAVEGDHDPLAPRTRAGILSAARTPSFTRKQ